MKNSIIIAKENVEVVVGTERMLALGGGVKAKIAKTKEGKSVIREFLFDRDRFSDAQAEKWVEDNQAHIDKSLSQVQENAPKGSFSDITARVSAALAASDILPKDSDGHQPWFIDWVFPDSVIVSIGDTYLKIGYKEEKGSFVFEAPEEVDIEFVAKEGAILRERIDKRNAPNIEIEETPKFIFREADKDKRQIKVILIEAGTNFSKKRHYPERTLKEAAMIFSGLKMFIDHPTQREEVEKPERSIEHWVATIIESWYEDRKIMARVQIHKDWFWESLSEDETFRNHIGISINTAGRFSMKMIDGEMMQVVEELTSPKSVDWVTEPGARGRVEALIESAYQKSIQEDDHTMLEKITLKELKESRPDLVEAISKSIQESASNKDKDAKIKKLEEDNIKLKETQKEKEVSENNAKNESKVKDLVESSKLPVACKEKVIAAHKGKSFDSEEALTKLVESAIKEEFEYAKRLGVGVKINNQQGVNESDNVAAGLEKALGLEEKKEEK